MEAELSLLSNLLAGSVLEAALGRYLSRNESGREILRALTGKVIAVSAPPLVERLYLIPTPDGMQVSREHRGLADLTLTGTPLAFAKLGARGMRRQDLFAGEIQISGDMGLAESLQRLFQLGEPRWGELAEEFIAPSAIGLLADCTREAREWGSHAAVSLQQDLGEFLREELRASPSQPEAGEFVASVDQLRDDCERLEARIRRLEDVMAETRRRPA